MHPSFLTELRVQIENSRKIEVNKNVITLLPRKSAMV